MTMAKANDFAKRDMDLAHYADGVQWEFALVLDPSQEAKYHTQLDERAAWFYEAATASKGMVTKKKGSFGKAFIFKPARAPETTYRSLAKDMVRRVFAGDSARMVTSLFEAHPPTKGELTKIQTLVNSAKRKAKASRR